MRKKNLFTTVLAAVAAMFIINVASGCGQKEAQPSQTAVQETQTKSQTKTVPDPTAAVQSASASKTTEEKKQKTSPFKLYVISKDGVNIRQDPSVSAESMGLGDYGDSYTCEGSVMGEDGSSWYQISYKGKTGYVSTAYASKNAPDGVGSSSAGENGSTSNGNNGTENNSSNGNGGSGNGIKKNTSDGSSLSSGTSSSTNSNSSTDDADSDGEASLNLMTIYVKSEDGTVVKLKEQTNGDYAYRDDNGTGYTEIQSDYEWQDQYGNTYYTLNDDTHRLGMELETHTLTSADGTTVTITEAADGPYRYRDANGVGYIDEGDGVWIDQYENPYTE